MNAPKMPLHHSPDYKPDAGEVSPPVAKLRAIIGERDKLRAENERLRAEFQRIADGDVMGVAPVAMKHWTHIQTVEMYQRIARAALAKDKP